MTAAISTRACRYDGTEMPAGPDHECPTCGWRVGLVPVGESRDPTGNTTVRFVGERPARWARVGLALVLLGCVVLVGMGLSGSVGLTLLGLAALVIVGLVVRESRFGRITWGLTPGMRVLTRVVVGAGVVLVFCTVIGIVVGMTGDRYIRDNL